MESSNEPRLQLLLLTKDLVHMHRMKAMLHAYGIQATSELTSPPWRSAGWESFLTVPAEDYEKASALCLDRELTIAFIGSVPLVTTEVDETLQQGVRK